MHCQNADWATHFLLHKFNITAQDSIVGTDFGKYVKYKRPERRGGKTFLSGKSWKTTVGVRVSGAFTPIALFHDSGSA